MLMFVLGVFVGAIFGWASGHLRGQKYQTEQWTPYKPELEGGDE